MRSERSAKTDQPRLGEQRPRVFCAPSGAEESFGAEAVDLARMAGLVLDPWQEHVLDVGLSRVGGKWCSLEVGLVVARQNGKGSVLEALELWALFLGGESLILHSAHEFKTAKDAYRRITSLIQNTPELLARVAAFPRNPSEFGVDLKTGQRLRFIARSGGSGRGYTADRVILDESFKLDGAAMAALLPTLSAVQNPQIWYASSAPMATSEQLHAVRERALSGDPGRLTYLEWSAASDCDPNSLDAVALANPALGIRINEEFVLAEREAMPLVEFKRERLSIPDSPAGSPVFDVELWRACEQWPVSEQPGRLTFAVEITPDRSAGCVVAAGVRSDKRVHVEVIEHREGVAWIVPRLADLSKRWRPGQLIVDPGGPAGSLLRELEMLKVRPRVLSTRELVQSCGAFYDGVVDGRVVHLGQESLTEPVLNARKRRLGDAWAWDRYGAGDASALVAGSIAFWAASSRKSEARAVNLSALLSNESEDTNG